MTFKTLRRGGRIKNGSRRSSVTPNPLILRVASTNSWNFHAHANRGLHADLFAAEQECESLKALISTLEASSHTELRRWEEIAEVARARRTEAEITASRRAWDLSPAMGHICNIREQLRDQRQLVCRKDIDIQSITRKSQLGHTKLRWAEYKITRLDENHRGERDCKVRETKELMINKPCSKVVTNLRFAVSHKKLRTHYAMHVRKLC